MRNFVVLVRGKEVQENPGQQLPPRRNRTCPAQTLQIRGASTILWVSAEPQPSTEGEDAP